MTDPRRIRSLVVDTLDDAGATGITPGDRAVTARLAGRVVAVTVTERADEYVSRDLHPEPDAPAPGWRRRFHVTVTVDGVDSVTVTSTDNTVGALACAIADVLRGIR
jgi:hypothetical protein